MQMRTTVLILVILHSAYAGELIGTGKHVPKPFKICPKGIRCLTKKAFIFCENNEVSVTYYKKIFTCVGDFVCDQDNPYNGCLHQSLFANLPSDKQNVVINIHIKSPHAYQSRDPVANIEVNIKSRNTSTSKILAPPNLLSGEVQEVSTPKLKPINNISFSKNVERTTVEPYKVENSTTKLEVTYTSPLESDSQPTTISGDSQFSSASSSPFSFFNDEDISMSKTSKTTSVPSLDDNFLTTVETDKERNNTISNVKFANNLLNAIKNMFKFKNTSFHIVGKIIRGPVSNYHLRVPEGHTISSRPEASTTRIGVEINSDIFENMSPSSSKNDEKYVGLETSTLYTASSVKSTLFDVLSENTLPTSTPEQNKGTTTGIFDIKADSHTVSAAFTSNEEISTLKTERLTYHPSFEDDFASKTASASDLLITFPKQNEEGTTLRLQRTVSPSSSFTSNENITTQQLNEITPVGFTVNDLPHSTSKPRPTTILPTNTEKSEKTTYIFPENKSLFSTVREQKTRSETEKAFPEASSENAVVTTTEKQQQQERTTYIFPFDDVEEHTTKELDEGTDFSVYENDMSSNASTALPRSAEVPQTTPSVTTKKHSEEGHTSATEETIFSSPQPEKETLNLTNDLREKITYIISHLLISPQGEDSTTTEAQPIIQASPTPTGNQTVQKWEEETYKLSDNALTHDLEPAKITYVIPFNDTFDLVFSAKDSKELKQLISKFLFEIVSNGTAEDLSLPNNSHTNFEDNLLLNKHSTTSETTPASTALPKSAEVPQITPSVTTEKRSEESHTSTTEETIFSSPQPEKETLNLTNDLREKITYIISHLLISPQGEDSTTTEAQPIIQASPTPTGNQTVEKWEEETFKFSDDALTHDLEPAKLTYVIPFNDTFNLVFAAKDSKELKQLIYKFLFAILSNGTAEDLSLPNISHTNFEDNLLLNEHSTTSKTFPASTSIPRSAAKHSDANYTPKTETSTSEVLQTTPSVTTEKHSEESHTSANEETIFFSPQPEKETLNLTNDLREKITYIISHLFISPQGKKNLSDVIFGTTKSYEDVTPKQTTFTALPENPISNIATHGKKNTSYSYDEDSTTTEAQPIIQASPTPPPTERTHIIHFNDTFDLVFAAKDSKELKQLIYKFLFKIVSNGTTEDVSNNLKKENTDFHTQKTSFTESSILMTKSTTYIPPPDDSGLVNTVRSNETKLSDSGVFSEETFASSSVNPSGPDSTAKTEVTHIFSFENENSNTKEALTPSSTIYDERSSTPRTNIATPSTAVRNEKSGTLEIKEPVEVDTPSDEEEEVGTVFIEFHKYRNVDSPIYTVVADLKHHDINYYVPNLDFAEIKITTADLRNVGRKQIGSIQRTAPWKLTFRSTVKTLGKHFLKDTQNLDEFEASTGFLLRIREGVFNGQSLKSLNLRDNRIRKISPHAFDNMPALKEISLINNRLSFYNPNWFHNCPNLQTIFLSFNRIKVLPPNAFKNLNLDLPFRIFLDYNDIVFISDNIFIKSPSDSLNPTYFENIRRHGERINLKGNQLMCVPDDISKVFAAKEITLERNPFTCECQKKIFKWSKEHQDVHLSYDFKSTCIVN